MGVCIWFSIVLFVKPAKDNSLITTSAVNYTPKIPMMIKLASPLLN